MVATGTSAFGTTWRRSAAAARHALRPGRADEILRRSTSSVAERTMRVSTAACGSASATAGRTRLRRPGPGPAAQPGKPPAGNQSEPGREDQDEQEAEPEVRHRDAELAEQRRRPVRPALAPGGRQHARAAARAATTSRSASPASGSVTASRSAMSAPTGIA